MFAAPNRANVAHIEGKCLMGINLANLNGGSGGIILGLCDDVPVGWIDSDAVIWDSGPSNAPTVLPLPFGFASGTAIAGSEDGSTIVGGIIGDDVNFFGLYGVWWDANNSYAATVLDWVGVEGPAARVLDCSDDGSVIVGDTSKMPVKWGQGSPSPTQLKLLPSILTDTFLNNYGDSYTPNATFDVTVVGGTYTTPATISVTADNTGAVTTINGITDPGLYSVLPTLMEIGNNECTGGAGSGLGITLTFCADVFSASPFTGTFSGGSCIAVSGDGTVGVGRLDLTLTDPSFVTYGYPCQWDMSTGDCTLLDYLPSGFTAPDGTSGHPLFGLAYCTNDDGTVTVGSSLDDSGVTVPIVYNSGTPTALDNPNPNPGNSAGPFFVTLDGTKAGGNTGDGSSTDAVTWVTGTQVATVLPNYMSNNWAEVLAISSDGSLAYGDTADGSNPQVPCYWD